MSSQGGSTGEYRRAQQEDARAGPLRPHEGAGGHGIDSEAATATLPQDHDDGLISSVRHSVRLKFMLVVLVTTFLALFLMGAAMMLYDLRAYRDAWVGDLFTQADLIGRASAPALAFDDEKVARENLSLLKELPKISAAAIYTARGTRFAAYARPEAKPTFPALPQREGYRIEGDELVLFKGIESNGETIGTVYFRAKYELAERLASYLTILGVVMAASLGLAVMMTSWLQKTITEPIVAMSGVARQVMSRRDYSLRVGKTTNDEVGYLVDTFNAMLAEIGGRTQQLETSNRNLELEMTERRNAEKALLAVDRQKDQFLATLAHELRNPLAPLLNALHLMRLPGNDGRASLATRELMERQLRQLVQLVDDLLDVSRINTGKLVLRKERCDLGSCIRIAMETVAPLIATRQHTLQLRLPKEPTYVEADPTRLSQVFVNLLNNAAKFTDAKGHISIVAAVSGPNVTVTVSDNGMGIAPDVLPQLFEMFAQADRSLERSHAGLGVGLSLARELVELHGGNIEGFSEGVGRGSRFSVTLPVLETSAIDTAHPIPEATNEAARLRILLADDNVDFATSLATLLESCGHDVCVTHDGMEALEKAAVFKPQLCFLDIGLPRLHGYDLARRLRELPETRDSVLVAISGWGQPEDKRRSREAGFDQHLAKPVDFDQILSLLDDFSLTRRAA